MRLLGTLSRYKETFNWALNMQQRLSEPYFSANRISLVATVIAVTLDGMNKDVNAIRDKVYNMGESSQCNRTLV